ncbi:MAG: hypothetical protein OFPI_22120 [Osedax symbiont Rs2]|nr:MAG: hypothetical protein OFPI_22120 [Osedax symbiont Rs2]
MAIDHQNGSQSASAKALKYPELGHRQQISFILLNLDK